MPVPTPPRQPAAVPTPTPAESSAEISRRQALGLGAAVVAATVLVDTSPAAGAGVGAGTMRTTASGATTALRSQAQSGAEALRPSIRPRQDWAGDLGVKGDLVPEDDVRFLLVHHTASTNEYGADDVASQIRGFYDFHTGPEKGWPDVAYNFFVDRFGGIWEGRQGSSDGPVRGDATGGSQGFALLCSLIGDFESQLATPEQQASLVQLLAWLAETYAVDTTVGATTTFVSRGSSKWPAGTEVTARTIAGHRDMSMTACPGDAVYALIATEFPTQVTELRAPDASAPDPEAEAEAPDVTATTTGAEPGLPATSPDSDSTVVESASSTPAAPGPGVGAESSEVAGAPGETGQATDDNRPWLLAAGTAVAAAAAAGIGAVTRVARRGHH